MIRQVAHNQSSESLFDGHGYCIRLIMDAVAGWAGTITMEANRVSSKKQARFLREKLVRLTLDWESAALTLDTERQRR
jgi:hypothetical protein